MFDSHPNLASGTILTPPTPASSGTTFSLYPGDGSAFAPNMPVTLCPPETQPDRDSAEIGYLTAVSTDTLTITRGREGTTALSVEAGWRVYGTITAKTITDIEEAVEAGADKHFEQAFTNVASVTVTHNLDKRPAVTVVDTAGDEVVGDVNHVTANELVLSFSAAFSGTVIVN